MVDAPSYRWICHKQNIKCFASNLERSIISAISEWTTCTLYHKPFFFCSSRQFVEPSRCRSYLIFLVGGDVVRIDIRQSRDHNLRVGKSGALLHFLGRSHIAQLYGCRWPSRRLSTFQKKPNKMPASAGVNNPHLLDCLPDPSSWHCPRSTS